MEKYQKIMVGIDGSEQSKLALERAIQLAKLADANILLVTVQNDAKFVALAGGASATYRMDPVMLDDSRQQIRDFLEKCTDEVKQAGIPVDAKIYYGDSKTELAEELPKKENVDLIVLGATGLNRLERVLIGSNTNYVVQNAKCDVVIVKDPADNK
ncbi:universal stress protein [Paucilactobacillus wasatchensis]|uniref:Universal stress protein n=1 Tax=Paucilactobacillus wasatchensis TaxID=1335616 RepID=A0A0D1AB62_9LACO|nr:universal stress protein [Paucilactobacillus wasatchensis]KIS03956.1 Universal stress protein family [Paucilactobacillus wasatchensis]